MNIYAQATDNSHLPFQDMITDTAIVNTLCAQLSWTHICQLNNDQ